MKKLVIGIRVYAHMLERSVETITLILIKDLFKIFILFLILLDLLILLRLGKKSFIRFQVSC